MSISELSKAIKQNDFEAVKTLLENGADFNSYRTVKAPIAPSKSTSTPCH